MRDQPSRTEPPDAVPEFRPDRGPRPSAPLRAAPGTCALVTLRTRDGREKWPPAADRVRLGYGSEGSRGPHSRRVARTGGPDGNRRARPLDIRERTPATLAQRAGVAIETTEDRA
ncbi:hypothetical protein ACFU7Y_12510 [Kitasatospora sp. NPDC057542]|uniref:hypothetical protein n=1 Tax=Streptomycetaceae TaxID=2062 RepID=UPI001CCA84E8|nr:hypothetical protein [Streptomyces sp. LS1784]